MAITPLLSAAMDAVEHTTGEARRSLASEMSASAQGGQLPISAQLPRLRPEKGEEWPKYRARVEAQLEPLREEMQAVMGIEAAPLLVANALVADADPDQIKNLDERKEVEHLELNAITQVIQMDDAAQDIELPGFRAANPGVDGSGVTVAVLDSGIDAHHPSLTVADAVSTSGEANSIPGSHGTHCAGSIASSDSIYGGVAPGVRLIDVKVLDHEGRGTSANIVDGVAAALDREAQVLSMSVGFNHLPRWSNGGHGWSCPNGDCVLCRAVDSAVALGSVVVVAAGNEHERAEALRRFGHGSKFDTELGCPGHAREVITVGALTKRTFDTASFSSRGPTAYGADQPDLAAPGVNIWSTVPVPRDPTTGAPQPSSPRGFLFGRKSGTSMATPIVAGAAALVVQKFQDAGVTWKPDDVRRQLLTSGVASLPLPAIEVGQGRLTVRNL